VSSDHTCINRDKAYCKIACTEHDGKSDLTRGRDMHSLCKNSACISDDISSFLFCCSPRICVVQVSRRIIRPIHHPYSCGNMERRQASQTRLDSQYRNGPPFYETFIKYGCGWQGFFDLQWENVQLEEDSYELEGIFLTGNTNLCSVAVYEFDDHPSPTPPNSPSYPPPHFPSYPPSNKSSNPSSGLP
jgi:hypothetical protein